MSILFILGNGFDLYHGIKTSYYDFKKWLEKNRYNSLVKKINNFSNNGFLGDCLNNKWSNVENALYLNKSIIDERDEEFIVLDALIKTFRDLFYKWILEINSNISSEIRCLYIAINDFYINFNYTSTLEKIYKIPENYGGVKHICHIHGGALSKETITFDNIKNKMNKDDDFAYKEYNFAFKKNVKKKIENLEKSFYFNANLIDKVVVIGHSIDFSNGDFEYFKYFSNKLNNKEWYFSYHNKDDLVHNKKVIKKLKLSKAFIVSMKDLEVSL